MNDDTRNENDDDILSLCVERIVQQRGLDDEAPSSSPSSNKRPRFSSSSSPPTRGGGNNIKSTPSAPRNVTLLRVPCSKVVPFEFPAEGDVKNRSGEFKSRMRPEGFNAIGPLRGVVELSSSSSSSSTKAAREDQGTPQPLASQDEESPEDAKANSPSSSSSSPRRRYLARLQLVKGDEGSYIVLGRFATRLDAARVHDFAALLQFGDDAELNFNDIILNEEKSPPELNKWFLKIVEGPSTPLPLAVAGLTPSALPTPLTADSLRVDLLSVTDWCESLLEHASEMLALVSAASPPADAGPTQITVEKVTRYVQRLTGMTRVLRAAVFRAGARITACMMDRDVSPDKFQDLESCEEIKEALRRTRGGRKRTNSG